MARSFPPGFLAAAQDTRGLIPRDYISLYPRSRDTGGVTHFGWHSDVGTIQAIVRNPKTGADEVRTFEGAGQLIRVSEVPVVANLTVQEVTIDLSAIAGSVADALRAWDPEQAQIEIYRGLLDRETRNQVGPAYCRFYGFVDGAPIRTPAAGGEGSAKLNCVGHTQELYRSNPDTRSHESQQVRAPGDTAFKYVEAMAQREIFWGQETNKGQKADGFFGKVAGAIRDRRA